MTWPTPTPFPPSPAQGIPRRKSRLRACAEIIAVIVGIAGLLVGIVDLWVNYQAWQHPMASTAGASVTPVASSPGPQTSPSTSPVQPPPNPPPGPQGGTTTGSPTPPAQDPFASLPTGDPEVKGGNGKDEPDSGPPKLFSGDKPFSIESGQGSPPQTPAFKGIAGPSGEGNPQVEPSDVVDPEVTMGEKITVTVKPLVEPQGAKPLRELRMPPVPRKDMKSGLSGSEIVCPVAVTAQGVPSADCGRSQAISDFSAYFRREAEEILEAAPWAPATDRNGEPCPGNVTVHFSWE
jgi:hypothetical protein